VFFDPLYLVIAVVTLILSGGAQLYLSSTYNKWGRTRNSLGLTGGQAGKAIVDRTPLGDNQLIRFERVPGQLTDHYDPSTHIVRMSDGVATQPSVASLAIVAHELGHAEQHEQRSPLIAMRNFLIPAVRFSPMASYVCIFAGLIFNFTGLLWLGVLFFAAMVLFSVVTLPVEFDASRRGLRLLRESNLVQSDVEFNGAKAVLTAAALTYVAAAIGSILQLLYYISLAQRSR
jgi:uncharacterized protein